MLLLPCFFTASLLSDVRRQLVREDFYMRRDKKIARELCMRKNALFNRLHFFLNDETLFGFIRSVTGCAKIRAFQGRLYQFNPGSKHYDSWHDDLGAHRLVGLSIHLGAGKYEGGFLEIKNFKKNRILARLKHRHPGDAILFRIAPDLKHRVTPVTGKQARVVFAGWFLAKPRFTKLL